MAAVQQRTISRMPLQIVRGDWNAFLTLGTDNLAKIVILPAILIGTFHLGPDIVFGRILPGLSLTLFVGLGIFGYLGVKLGAVQERSDVTALPHGISTPAMFVFLFGIVGPVYFASKDPLLAYRIGLGAAFLGGLIELSGAVIGPFLQRVTPKAGILGTMAGVAIVWIAMIPSAIIFANPIIGLPALFGSPFPTTVYLGHPAYKEMGARTGYVLLTGLLLLVASLVSVFAFLKHLIPAAAISPLLVFVGIVMTHYAFQATPPAHGVAVAFALVPHIADLLKKQLDGTLLEVLQQGSAPTELMSRLAENQGVYLQSYGLLSRGAIITGMLWGSILSFLVDHDLRKATIFSLAASVLSLTGLIHAEQIGISLSPITIGYLVLTIILGLLHLANSRRAKADVQASGSVIAPDPVVSTEAEI